MELSATDWSNFEEKYDLGRFIGKGQFGHVWECRDRATKESLCCKVFDKSSLKTREAASALRSETAAMKLLKGKASGVVQLREVLQGQKTLFMVMEYCRGGDMYQLLAKRGKLSEEPAKQLFVQLASALEVCHNLGVVHRDIKLNNILLDRSATCLYSTGWTAASESSGQSAHSLRSLKALRAECLEPTSGGSADGSPTEAAAEEATAFRFSWGQEPLGARSGLAADLRSYDDPPDDSGELNPGFLGGNSSTAEPPQESPVRAEPLSHRSEASSKEISAAAHSLRSDPAFPVQAKLADFGFAVVLRPGDTTEGFVGSRFYMAPEVYQGQPYGRRVDIWSLGVVLCVMLTGTMPFIGRDRKDRAGLKKTILSGKMKLSQREWGGLSEEAKDLVCRMLTVDPKFRLRASEIFAHPWLSNVARPSAALASPCHSVRSAASLPARRGLRAALPERSSSARAITGRDMFGVPGVSQGVRGSLPVASSLSRADTSISSSGNCGVPREGRGREAAGEEASSSRSLVQTGPKKTTEPVLAVGPQEGGVVGRDGVQNKVLVHGRRFPSLWRRSRRDSNTERDFAACGVPNESDGMVQTEGATAGHDLAGRLSLLHW